MFTEIDWEKLFHQPPLAHTNIVNKEPNNKINITPQKTQPDQERPITS